MVRRLIRYDIVPDPITAVSFLRLRVTLNLFNNVVAALSGQDFVITKIAVVYMGGSLKTKDYK